MDEKIDFVVTYLDSTDSVWKMEKEKYSGKKSSEELNGEERYRNLDTFKYWLRGVDKFAPWVNSIKIVTYGHLPEYLNINHPKIEIIKHEDYISKEFLPTFNSSALEMNLDKIPDISENFVYFNDDMFLTSKTIPTDFFKLGKARLQNLVMPIQATQKFNNVLFNNILVLNENILPQKIISWKMLSLKNGLFAVLVNLYQIPLLLFFKRFIGFLPDHLPYAVTKTAYSKVRKIADKEFLETSSSKFRGNDNITIWLIQDYLRATNEYAPRNSFKFGKFVSIAPEINYSQLLNSKFKVVCINDGQPVSNFEDEKARLEKAFENKFPEKSSFEI